MWATLRRIVLQSKSKPKPEVIQSGNHWFPLNIWPRERVIIYPSNWGVPIVGETITWWRISSLSIQTNVLLQTKKALEAKIGALEERFKSLVSSGQILDSPSSSGAQASSSTSDYYMFEASGEVVSFAAVTCAKAVSRATPATTGELVASLRAQDNARAD